MKVEVRVYPKEGVLDPQGKAIAGALSRLGHASVTDVRAGKEIQVGSTPFTASLKRGAGYFKKAKYQVTFEKPGYKTEAITLEDADTGARVFLRFIENFRPADARA